MTTSRCQPTRTDAQTTELSSRLCVTNAVEPADCSCKQSPNHSENSRASSAERSNGQQTMANTRAYSYGGNGTFVTASFHARRPPPAEGLVASPEFPSGERAEFPDRGVHLKLHCQRRSAAFPSSDSASKPHPRHALPHSTTALVTPSLLSPTAVGASFPVLRQSGVYNAVRFRGTSGQFAR